MYRNQKGQFTSQSLKGSNNPRWNGGRSTSSNGRIIILVPNHPYANKRGYVSEYRLIMEKHIARYLLPSEQVHHINGDPTDNRIENLKIVSPLKHAQAHGPYKRLYNRVWLYAQYVIQDKSAQQIADEIGCHINTVRQHLHNFKITKSRIYKTKFPKLHDKEWLRDKKKTMTYQQIADFLGCSLSNVYESLNPRNR